MICPQRSRINERAGEEVRVFQISKIREVGEDAEDSEDGKNAKRKLDLRGSDDRER